MENEIQDLIAKFKAKGYSDEQIKAFLVQRKGFEANDVEAEFGAEKKNFDSPSASQSDSEVSQEYPSDTDTTPQAEQSASDSSSSEDSRVRKINKTRELGAALGNFQEQSSYYENWYSSPYDEDAMRPDDYFQTAGFVQAGGVSSTKGREEEIQFEFDTRQEEERMYKDGSSLEEIFNYGQTQRGTYSKMNELYKEISSEGNGDLFVVNEETGITELQPKEYADFSLKMQEILLDDEKRLKEEMQKVEDKTELGEIGYDLWTGTRSIGYGFMGLWNPEQSQYNLYQDQTRTQASYKVEGLTDEEIERGLFGNLSDGNMNAFSTMFGTQLAQTAPQLAMQAAVAAGSGGLGLSASSAMWVSSGVMGLQTFGQTSAQYYGLVDDNKRYAMALGDALVETLSERAFPDDMLALTKGKYKGVGMDQIRRDFFGVGVMSKEFRKLAGEQAARTGRGILESGLEEGMEEFLAGVGSQYVHALINDEDFNLYETIDGMIVGFGAGAKSRGFRTIGESITATASSLGYGGIRSELIKIRSTKQALRQEIMKTTDATRKAQLETKLKSIQKIEIGIKSEMDEVYSEYSDEDAQNTIKQNQRFQNAMLNHSKATNSEQKSQARAEAKDALNQIKAIESKYDNIRLEIKKQKEANQEWLNSQETSVEVNADTKLPDTPLMKGIQMVANALQGKSKVYIHKNLEDASQITGKSKMDLAGANGFFIADDGSVHVMAAQAQQNTAYHEGFHRILREVDGDYAKRFVDAAFKGMDEETSKKYKSIYNAGMKRGGQALAVEETFAELAADITAGNINAEGAGSSLILSAMGSLAKSLAAIGIPVKPRPSFKEFADYVQEVSNDFKSGKSVADTKGKFGSNQVQEGKFNQQLFDGMTYFEASDFPKLTPQELQQYKDGDFLTQKTVEDVLYSELILNSKGKPLSEEVARETVREKMAEDPSYAEQVEIDRESFDTNMEINGRPAKAMVEQVLKGLEQQQENMLTNSKMTILADMLSKGLFDNSFIILDNRGMMEYHQMGNSSGFFHNSRDDSFVINYPYELSADWLAGLIIHEQMHRLTALEVDKKDSKFSKAIGAVMDGIEAQWMQMRAESNGIVNTNAVQKKEEQGVESLSQFEATTALMQEYGFTNRHEMIAEAFSNPEFQQLLTKMPVDESTKQALSELGFSTQQNRSFFDVFKQVVKNLMNALGVRMEAESMFDAVVLATDELLNRQEREGNNSVFFQMQDPMTTAGMVKEMNELANKLSIDPDALTETEKKSAEIRVEELSERLGFDFKNIKYEDWADIPMVFSISDQLTSGDVVNPNTGNTITNLMGGLGFHGAHPKHAKLAWANIDDQTALDQINQAKEVYENNKEVYDELWASGKVKQGHVVMGIVRMGNSSMNSNEAVLRVAADNLTAFPIENRRKAFTALVERLESQIAQNKKSIESGVGASGKKLTPLSIKNMEKTNGEMQDVLNKAKAEGVSEVSELLTTEFLKKLNTIAAVAHITNNLLYGSAFEVGQDTKRLSAPKIAPAMALMEGMEDSKRELINKGFIMDIITEKQMKGVPQRSLVSLSAVDITENGGLGESAHPNYPAAAKGYPIGIFGKPRSIVELMPKVKEQLTYYATSEATGDVKKLSTSGRLTQRVPVQTGLGNIELRGSAINEKQESKITDLFNRSFPYVNFFTDSKTFEKVSKDKDAIELVNKNGNIYAYRLGNRVFFDESVFNSESDLGKMQMAEMADFWIEQMSTSKKGRAIIQQGMDIIMNTDEFKDNENSYKDRELMAKRMLSKAIAEKGDSIKKAAQRSKFNNWVSAVYAYVKSALGIKSVDVKIEDIPSMTLNEIVNVSLADILGGKPTKVTAGQMRQLINNKRKETKKERIFFQSTMVGEVSNRILLGEKKADIISSLQAKGMSRDDANLVYAKASQYARGAKKGWTEGQRNLSKEYAKRRKKELKNEREEAKALRKRAKELFKREKKVTDAMVEEIFNYVKGMKGVNIKLSQMKTIMRLMKSANRKVYGNGAKTHRNYAVFLSFVDAVAKIVDKQVDAKQMEDHAKLLRAVSAQQKKLALRVKKMNKVSRSPLASYIQQVENLTSVDAGLLTFETLQSLSSALIALQNTTKTVGARIQGEDATLTKPYVYIEELDTYIDTRSAKIYFDEMYDNIKSEADQRQEAILIERAMDIAFEDGTDWHTAYQELLRKKDLTAIEKKLEAIAEEMDLDIENIQDLEAILELYEEQQKENKSKIRQAIIQDAILPTFQNWKQLLLSNEDFAKIFGYNSDFSEEAAMEFVEQRIKRLTLTELKKLEFFMFDFIANGKTYGLQALAAAAEAKNEGNNRLRKLNMKAETTKGLAKNLRNGYFNLFENTPTFFRRVFKKYSQAKVAQYMNAIGFGSLRNSAAQAEARSATFVQAVQNMLKNKNLNNIKSQTEMLVYSVLSQKPDGVSSAAWVVNLKASLKLSLENDTRLTDEQKKEVQSVLDKLDSAESMESVMSELEKNEDLMFGIDFLRKAFKTQEAGVKDYAESFLGMQFRSEDNYLPMNFRAVGSNAENLQELADRVENVGKAFKSHARTKAQAVAGAVYERNENALRSDKRYIDINFFASIEKTYKENEIKVATARDVAYVSAMTSESNKDFANSVPDAGIRAQIRKKIYNYLVNASDYQQADEVLGKHGRSFVNYATNLTVVAYFGATIEQIVKQSSALMNAMIEARSMAARIHYVNTIIESITPEFARGEDGFKVTNAKRKLMSKFGISNRDVVSETLSVVGGNKIGEKTRFEKGVELSTAALRGTDKMAATATWIAYYVDYLVSEEGVKPNDINWETEAEKPNNDAAQFADQMTIKDQNINSRRDKSKINEMTRGQALNIVKMIAMPFANFLLNKKINLSLDFQKVTMGDKKNRLEGLRSIAGTVAEVAAFQGATWMVLAPLYSVIGSALFGGDDEEESWWDKNFGKKMFKRGFFLDMNPLVVPIAAVENYMVRGINMAEYMLTEDPDDFHFADEDWNVGFERWEKLNGLPIFSSAGRGDLNVGGALGMLGVTGSVLNEIRLSMKNMVTLAQNEPFYTNRNGKERFVSREDAEQMQLIETMRTVMNAVMMVTGLQSKELAKITKSAKRPIEKRSTTDKESWIAKEIMNDASVGIDDMLGYLTTEIEGDPMNAGRKIDQIIKKAKGSMVDDFVSGANINTLRLIDKSEASNRGRAVLIHQIADTMSEAEAKQFYLDSYMYFGIKYGVETVKAQIFSDIMKYE